MGLFQIVLAVGVFLLNYFLAPKPKKNKPPEVEEQANPTASAGKPIIAIFGCIEVQEPNVIRDTDKRYQKGRVRA